MGEQETAEVAPVARPGHKSPCSCNECKQSKSSGHQNWRERRNQRYFGTPVKCSVSPQQELEEEQFLGPVLGNAVRIAGSLANAARKHTGPAKMLAALPGNVTKSPVISVGKRQRDALLQHWTQKLQRARSAAVKQKYQQYIDTIRKRQRPSWHQSEKDLQALFKAQGMPGQQVFLNNQPTKMIQRPGQRPIPPRGSVVPDINPADAMIEVKNYNINNQDALIRTLQQQIGRRMQQGPKGPTGNPLDQKIALDMRGQKATYDQLIELAKKVANSTGLAPENVQVVTWEIGM